MQVSAAANRNQVIERYSLLKRRIAQPSDKSETSEPLQHVMRSAERLPFTLHGSAPPPHLAFTAYEYLQNLYTDACPSYFMLVSILRQQWCQANVEFPA